jgi:hypothetical protein
MHIISKLTISLPHPSIFQSSSPSASPPSSQSNQPPPLLTTPAPYPSRTRRALQPPRVSKLHHLYESSHPASPLSHRRPCIHIIPPGMTKQSQQVPLTSFTPTLSSHIRDPRGHICSRRWVVDALTASSAEEGCQGPGLEGWWSGPRRGVVSPWIGHVTWFRSSVGIQRGFSLM